MKIVNFVSSKFSKKLNTLIFFVTTKCNSRCKSCFYWKELNQNKKELTLAEIEKISKKIGKFDNLLISGGEPFLRDDLPQIVEIFYKNSRIKSVNIPTNATLTEKIIEKTEEMLKKCNIKISINISLDGLEKTHDKLRGVSGTFKKLIQTEKELRRLKKKYNNLDINLTTIISNANFREIERLIEFAKTNMKIDYHSLEVMRGNPKDKSMKLPPIQEIKKLLKYAENNTKKGLKEKIKKNRSLALNRVQLEVLSGKKWSFRCLAGKTAAVLEPDGGVRICELFPVIGNVKDYDYDLKKVLNSKKAKRMKEMVKKNKCSCTHCVFITESLEHTPTKFIKEILLK